jgi:predicted CXXCH cytochrome family protein
MKAYVIFSITLSSMLVLTYCSYAEFPPDEKAEAAASKGQAQTVTAKPSATIPLVVKRSLKTGEKSKGSDSITYEHSPYATKACEACHGSDKPSDQDLTAEIPDLCYGCHDRFSKAFLHSPVSVGECLICHNPHKSGFKSLLNMEVPTLCYQCHDRMQKIITDKNYTVHPPAAGKCTTCHNPHESSVSSKLLAKDIKSLCSGCHIKENVPMQRHVMEAAFKHKPAIEKESCSNCHEPHSSPFEYHLKAEPMDLCLKCHNRQLTAYDGSILMDMKALLENNPSWHGPIREKNCSACHNPHGSNNFRILRHGYPAQFYTEEFSIDRYELCFSCHDSSIIKDKETTTFTNFRNGKTNLHFLHVNRKKKGRTCRACHETHASKHPKHIRDSVPFGRIRWQLKLKYKVIDQNVKTGAPCERPGKDCIQAGGSCVGCHARKSYRYR